MKRWRKLREWSRLFSEYAAAQSLIRLLGILAGLWLVNLLPVREYALYTLALSIFTFLSIFSDLGVGSALLYFWRETRSTQVAFSPYVRAAFRIRRTLVVLGGCVGLVFFAAIGLDRGFATIELAAAGAMLVASVWVQVGSSIAILQLRLEGLYRESYLAEVVGNAARLSLVALMWVFTLPLAWLAMLTGAVGSLVTSISAARRVPPTAQAAAAQLMQELSPLKDIVRYLLPTLLSAVYFSIQGPLTVWLSALFAGTESIAEVGALGRLGVIFSLVSGFVGAILIPRLSVVTDESHYLRRYLQLWAVLAGFGGGVVLFAYALPEWILLLLGDGYSGLAQGVFLTAVSAVLGTWIGLAVGVNNARGWMRLQPAALVLFVGIQVFLIVALDLSTTIGVLLLGVWSGVVGLALQLGLNAIGFTRPDWVALRKE